MKRILFLLLVGIVGYAIFLLLYLPMPLALQWSGGLPANISVYGLRGNLMHGYAEALVWQNWRLDRVDWRLSPGQLLKGRLGYRLKFTNPDGNGQATAAIGLTGNTHLEDVDLRVSMAYLSRQWSLPSRFGGDLELLLQEVSIEGGAIANALGSLTWSGAHLRGDPPVPLGSFQARIEASDKGFEGPISDNGGVLSAIGTLHLNTDGHWSLRGKLALREPSNTPVARLLDSLGTAGSDGKFPFVLKGALPLDAEQTAAGTSAAPLQQTKPTELSQRPQRQQTVIPAQQPQRQQRTIPPQRSQRQQDAIPPQQPQRQQRAIPPQQPQRRQSAEPPQQSRQRQSAKPPQQPQPRQSAGPPQQAPKARHMPPPGRNGPDGHPPAGPPGNVDAPPGA